MTWAMSGARPLYLTVGFILEEGLPLDQLLRIVDDMATAARQAGVTIVAGDTKVVERGHGDGCYINTTGIGVLPPDRTIAVDRAQVGDAVLVSGTMADHAMAIMSVREGLEFESSIRSDTACLVHLVQEILQECPTIAHCATRRAVDWATTLNEIATASRCGIELYEADIPVDDVVRSACEFLGLDPVASRQRRQTGCDRTRRTGRSGTSNHAAEPAR